MKVKTRAWAQNVQEDLLHLPICVLGHSKLLFSILAHPNASPYFTVKAIMLISESLNSSHETVAGGGILIKTITLLGTLHLFITKILSKPTVKGFFSRLIRAEQRLNLNLARFFVRQNNTENM